MDNTRIFIPQTIRVGYQARKDTYTQRLAYVIYFDEKGKIRKETSWESWRDKTLAANDFTNTPTEGFVLNKKAGGYSTGWNHRQTYTRVYDPRGFEFEISIENLLYILENTNSIVGKGLEGAFVYGWVGGNLLLLPTASPDYAEIMAYTQALNKPVGLKGKDLILGATYATKSEPALIYLGRFPHYERKWDREAKGYQYAEPRMKYFFEKPDTKSTWSRYVFLTSPGAIIQAIDENIVYDFADRFARLQRQEVFSPIDHVEYIPLPHAEVVEKERTDRYARFFDASGNQKDIMLAPGRVTVRDNSSWRQDHYTEEEFLASPYPQLYIKNTILANGEIMEP